MIWYLKLALYVWFGCTALPSHVANGSTKKIVLREGYPARLLCDSPEGANRRFAWRYGNDSSDADEEIRKGWIISDTNGALFLMNVTKSDQGFYECEKIQDSSFLIGSSYTVTVSSTGSIQSGVLPYSSPNQSVLAGESVVLECITRCGKNIIWRKHRSERFRHKGILLKINHVNMSHGGVYTCSCDQQRRNISLRVHEPASAKIVEPKNHTVTIEVGNSVHFRCKVKGSGNVHIKWFLDNVLYTGGRENIHMNKSGKTSTLSIKYATQQDIMSVKCSARNRHGTGNSSSVSLRVIAKPSTPTPVDMKSTESLTVGPPGSLIDSPVFLVLFSLILLALVALIGTGIVYMGRKLHAMQKKSTRRRRRSEEEAMGLQSKSGDGESTQQGNKSDDGPMEPDAKHGRELHVHVHLHQNSTQQADGGGDDSGIEDETETVIKRAHTL